MGGVLEIASRVLLGSERLVGGALFGGESGGDMIVC